MRLISKVSYTHIARFRKMDETHAITLFGLRISLTQFWWAGRELTMNRQSCDYIEEKKMSHL